VWLKHIVRFNKKSNGIIVPEKLFKTVRCDLNLIGLVKPFVIRACNCDLIQTAETKSRNKEHKQKNEPAMGDKPGADSPKYAINTMELHEGLLLVVLLIKVS
jgi:hypothetical protein